MRGMEEWCNKHPGAALSSREHISYRCETSSYTRVLPSDMVENLISLCKSLSRSYLHQYAVQAGHLLLKEGPIRRLLHAFSSAFPRDAPAPASGLRGPQAETDGKGQERTSPAVHRRWLLPAAIAGVRWRSRCANRLPSRSRGCTSATRSALCGRDLRDSRRATTPDGRAGAGNAVPSPRCDAPGPLFHVGSSD
jgi:hypothetical protein